MIHHSSSLCSIQKQSKTKTQRIKKMEAKVISCTTFGEDKVIKIVVSSRRAVTNYKPGENETTVVVADDTCSKKDVEEIKKTCEKLDYVYEGRLHEDYAQTNIGPGLV
ncbi:unnamed protein product [Brassica napus]|nr:unnamed protein product [Brassica napus]